MHKICNEQDMKTFLLQVFFPDYRELSLEGLCAIHSLVVGYGYGYGSLFNQGRPLAKRLLL